MSEFVEKEGKADADEAGDYYLAKPFDIDQLLAKIDGLMNPPLQG